MKALKNGELDIIIPVGLQPKPEDFDTMIDTILSQKERYGFNQFLLTGPSKGWRSIGHPPISHYEDLARIYLRAKNILEPKGIRLGWWDILTMKSGPSPDFSRMVKEDGTETPMASCPMDPAFRKRFADSAAAFVRIADPDFMILEDDYSVHAAAGGYGCFCEHHMKEFARRQGREYTREELVELFKSNTAEGYQLLKQWRELIKDSLVMISQELREAVDSVNPAIPIGYMQSGSCDRDGDCTEAVCKALAGPNHTPFSRLYGTFYCGAVAREIPNTLYHALQSRERITGDFRYYHESDSFPHTRFYSAGNHMRTIMATAYSYGFDGSTFQAGDPTEETAFGKMFTQERARFNLVHRAAKQCRLKGVQMRYDPFWNSVLKAKRREPLWLKSVALCGVPYTSVESKVEFMDWRQAKYADEAEIEACLRKCLIVDGEAALCLQERGYGKYIGVQVGSNVFTGMRRFDIAAKEIVTDAYATEGKGRAISSANCYAASAGNGIMRELTITDPACRVVTELFDAKAELMCPGMTEYDNELGGRVIVMGMTVEGNGSQALFHYRRQRLFQKLISNYADEYVFAKDVPDVFVIMNEAKEDADFIGMISLNNLCEDDLPETELHIPATWKKFKELLVANEQGEWEALEYIPTKDGVLIQRELRHLKPMFILVK